MTSKSHAGKSVPGASVVDHPRIGYVGLGMMGGALARQLQRRHALVVYDQSTAAVQRLVDIGAAPAASLEELASGCAVVLLCLPTSDEVRAVIFGSGGLASSLKAGSLIIDQTSGDPRITRALATELAELKIALVDAPITGGVQAAEAGTASIMVGADETQWTRAQQILACISPNISRAGDVGAGHAIKLVNNLLSTAQRLLSLEAVALAVKNGIDPRTAVEILAVGGGRNAYLEKVMGQQVIAGELDHGFTLALAHKDVKLACELGQASAVPMFFGNLTRELYQLCIAELGPQTKVDRAAQLVDRLAGTQVVPPDAER